MKNKHQKVNLYLTYKDDIDLIRNGIKTCKIMLSDLEERFTEIFDKVEITNKKYHRFDKYGYREFYEGEKL